MIVLRMLIMSCHAGFIPKLSLPHHLPCSKLDVSAGFESLRRHGRVSRKPLLATIFLIIAA